MTTIGIIGANGQVGTEVCLLLQCLGARPVAVCRSELAGAFLRRAGVECRVGRLSTPAEAASLLEGCDLVADFSLVRGAASEMFAAIRRMVTLVAGYAPKGSRYVYVSSEMAYGMTQESMLFQQHLFSRTLYGASKRYGERLAFRMGRKAGREVYALRLGQVHGELQNESGRILSQLRPGPAIVPDELSDTVFAFTLAEALVRIAEGREKPGLYTVVSQPQWSWKEVYEYYACRRGVMPEAVPIPPSQYAPLDPRGLERLRVAVRSFAMQRAMRFRESLSAYVLHRFPRWERRLAASYRRQNAARDIARRDAAQQYRPCDARLGAVLGQRLKSLSDSRETMPAVVLRVQELLEEAAPRQHGQTQPADLMNETGH